MATPAWPLSAPALLLGLHRAPPGAVLMRLQLGPGATVAGGPLGLARGGLGLGSELDTGAAGAVEAGGFFVISPDDAIALMDRINADVDVLWQDIDSAPPALGEFRSRFDTWRMSWKLWRTKNSDWWALFWSAPRVQEELEKWEKNLGAWREEFKRQGGNAISPAPPPPGPLAIPPGPKPPVLSTLDNISTAVIAVSVIGGLIVVYKAWKG